ncbi:hypothetical protein M501DRAFT_987696 [Patellaria atrata CBS 101060]|uniref:Uncharacterized protein n=1 Tax=Patellaria atrata CBS 101060 TaxID=1346257 RepID=A0A9P4VND0_9PEZI|nr:hypothetical protein M501DRAFT_987696 [Patellaria atrata CBS 101060]
MPKQQQHDVSSAQQRHYESSGQQQRYYESSTRPQQHDESSSSSTELNISSEPSRRLGPALLSSINSVVHIPRNPQPLDQLAFTHELLAELFRRLYPGSAPYNSRAFADALYDAHAINKLGDCLHNWDDDKVGAAVIGMLEESNEWISGVEQYFHTAGQAVRSMAQAYNGAATHLVPHATNILRPNMSSGMNRVWIQDPSQASFQRVNLPHGMQPQGGVNISQPGPRAQAPPQNLEVVRPVHQGSHLGRSYWTKRNWDQYKDDPYHDQPQHMGQEPKRPSITGFFSQMQRGILTSGPEDQKQDKGKGRAREPVDHDSSSPPSSPHKPPANNTRLPDLTGRAEYAIFTDRAQKLKALNEVTRLSPAVNTAPPQNAPMGPPPLPARRAIVIDLNSPEPPSVASTAAPTPRISSKLPSAAAARACVQMNNGHDAGCGGAEFSSYRSPIDLAKPLPKLGGSLEKGEPSKQGEAYEEGELSE